MQDRLSRVDRPLRIVQVNTSDAAAGGAEKFAFSLHGLFRDMGHRSTLVVGRKRSDDPDVVEIDNRPRGAASSVARWMFERVLNWKALSFPGSFRLDCTVRSRWDVLFLHNLHGAYFDLRAIPRLSRLAPVVLRLHDCWMLTGGCAYPLECDRWRRECRYCPRLRPQSRLRALKTCLNWRHKRLLANRSNMYLSVPCEWVANMLGRSPLEGLPARIDPYGIDTRTFTPGNRQEARRRLGLSGKDALVLFSANVGLRNPYKDGETLLDALRLLRERLSGNPPKLVVLGARGGDEGSPALPDYVLNQQFIDDEAILADYYRAADVYAHATKADTCGLVNLEAMACGTPVVATDIGGIPDYVRHEDTGLLVRPRSPEAMAGAILRVLKDRALAGRLVSRALREVREKFDIRSVAARYVKWFRELADRSRDGRVPA